MDLIKRVLKLIAFGAILAIVVNDVGRYAEARYAVENLARDAAEASAAAVRSNPSDRTGSWQAGESLVKSAGATVYGFDIKDGQTFVWVRMPVERTVLLQPASALIRRMPSTTPLLVEDDSKAIVQY